MTDLRDSKLTAAQLNVLVELNSTGKLPKGVRPRTIEILREGKYIDVTRVGTEDPVYILREEGKQEIGAKVDETFHEKLMADVAELEKALTTPEEVKAVAASQGIVLTDQEASKVAQEEVYIDPAALDWDYSKFNKDWALWERELLGFESVNYFRNTDVWHGLTAKEIKADIKTARPIGRQGQRAYQRQVRKAVKQLVGAL